MGWLREVMWGFNAITAYFTVIPVVVGGAMMAWGVSRAASARRRAGVLVGIVFAQALASSLAFLPGGAEGVLIVLLPVSTVYPYLNLASLLFFWIPVAAQVAYVVTRPAPKPTRTALVGFGAIAAGFVFLLVGAGIVGAEMD